MKRLQVNMLRLTLIAFFGLFAVGTLRAQCVSSTADPCISVSQSTLDRMAKALDTLKAAEATIAAFQHERGATDAERKAWVSFKEIAESSIAIFQKGVADRDKVIELQQKALETMAQLNDKLLKEINKPKSAWSKFLGAVKAIITLTAGITIGRGL